MENSRENATRNGPEQEHGTPMPQTGNPRNAAPVRGTLNIGGIIGRTFKTLITNPAVFFGLAFVIMIPPAVLEAIVPQNSPLKLGVILIEMILGFIVQGAIAYAVYQTMKGNAVSIGGAVSRSATALVPLILTSVLASVGMMFGMIFFIIPGLILWSMWFVAIPACVVEKTGAVASLRRSAFLTKGFRWQIFALVLLTSILLIALVSVATSLLLSLTGSYPVATLIGNIIGVLPQAFSCVLYAIVYHDLRAIKEGISLENLTSVFE